MSNGENGGDGGEGDGEDLVEVDHSSFLAISLLGTVTTGKVKCKKVDQSWTQQFSDCLFSVT